MHPETPYQYIEARLRKIALSWGLLYEELIEDTPSPKYSAARQSWEHLFYKKIRLPRKEKKRLKRIGFILRIKPIPKKVRGTPIGIAMIEKMNELRSMYLKR